MWLSLLARFWKPLLGTLVVLAILYAAYSHGRKAERAEWEPRFAAAEKAKAEADARAEAKEGLARRLSAESDQRYADTIFRLNERAVDAQRDIRQLVRLIATRGEQVPSDSATTGSPDAAATGDSRIDGAAVSIADTGRRCEADAAALAELQRYVQGQFAALN
jgi:cbb3-type cytochrome oxidase subunit 3